MPVHYDRAPNPTSHSSYKARSTPIQTFQELKSGKIQVQQTFHLRGLTQDEALKVVEHMLSRTTKQTLYLLIHGKGHRSENNTPVLKAMLLNVLYRHPQVNAYCKATPKDGGDGALYVLATSR